MLRFTKNRRNQWVVEGTTSELLGPGTTSVRTRKGTRTVAIRSVGSAFTRNGTRMRYGYLADARPGHRVPAARMDMVGRPGG